MKHRHGISDAPHGESYCWKQTFKNLKQCSKAGGFVCPWILCGKVYQHKISVVRHFKIHTSDQPRKPNAYKCQACDLNFTSRAALRLHGKICLFRNANPLGLLQTPFNHWNNTSDHLQRIPQVGGYVSLWNYCTLSAIQANGPLRLLAATPHSFGMKMDAAHQFLLNGYQTAAPPSQIRQPHAFHCLPGIFPSQPHLFYFNEGSLYLENSYYTRQIITVPKTRQMGRMLRELLFFGLINKIFEFEELTTKLKLFVMSEPLYKPLEHWEINMACQNWMDKLIASKYVDLGRKFFLTKVILEFIWTSAKMTLQYNIPMPLIRFQWMKLASSKESVTVTTFMIIMEQFVCELSYMV